MIIYLCFVVNILILILLFLLQLNIGKTKIIYFYNDKMLTNINNLITINNQTIECVKQYKCIGIQIKIKII